MGIIIKKGDVCLVREDENGNIKQLAMSVSQHEMLQLFVASISENMPLISMGEDYDLILKHN